MTERVAPADRRTTLVELTSTDTDARGCAAGSTTTVRTTQPARPPWESAARQLLLDATRRIKLIGWATPTNLVAELASLCHDWQSGRKRLPRFEYPSVAIDRDLGRRLAQATQRWARLGPLGELYADRARELALELELGRAIAQRRFPLLANRRYGPRDCFDDRSDRCCARWLAEPVPDTSALPHIRSDDESNPRSLVRRLRAEVATHQLRMRVVATDRLAALAAIGPGVIYVLQGRRLAQPDVERTVLHEIHGHALPRQRACRVPLGLFACGTAHGSDDQEGRALSLEEDAGLLGPARRQELALRHVAARSVEQGASFVETARELGRYPVALFDRLRIAARVHRGGGLARERIYVPAFLRVGLARQSDPTVDAVLGCGRIAVDAAERLRPWVR